LGFSGVVLALRPLNLRARDHRSSANKRDACSTAAHASRLCSPPPQPPRLGTPVVRKQAGRLFYRSTRVPLVFSAPNLRARDHRSSANKRDACSTAAHASRLCSPPPQPPRPGSPVVRKQAGRLFYRSTRVPLVFPAPNLRQRPREGVDWRRSMLRWAACKPVTPKRRDWRNLRQPEPSGLASRGAREWRRVGAWRRTLRAKSVRTNAAEVVAGSTRIAVGRRKVSC